MRRALTVQEQSAELAQLEALQRVRPLTAQESDRVANLVDRERQRGYRAHAARRRMSLQHRSAA